MTRLFARSKGMGSDNEPAMLKQRVEFLEDLLTKERSRHESHLREISSAAGCREARAISLCASWRGATLDSSGSEHANIGPGAEVSPSDTESRSPPQGAQDTPPASKLDRWVKRAKTPSISPPEGTSPSTAPKSKLDRWLAKSKPGQEPSPPAEGVTKLDRWLSKSKKPESSSTQVCLLRYTPILFRLCLAPGSGPTLAPTQEAWCAN